MLLLSATSFIDSFGIKPVEAADIAMHWGYLDDYDANEYGNATAVCEYIAGLFDAEGYYDENAYWDDTTADYVEACMEIQNDPAYGVDFVTNWWVGDFYADESIPPGPFGHFWLYGYDNDDIVDYYIRYWATEGGTVASKQYFNFIWSCGNGGLWWNDNSGNYDNVSGIFYPLPTASPVPTNTNDEYGFLYNGVSAVGMPYAWTGRVDMDIDGYNSYSGDYCYIGFEGASPFMKNNLPGISETAVNFPARFYRYLLGYDYPYTHQSVSCSLDYASYYTYGGAFSSSDLYTGYWVPAGGYWFCHMRVFGNGDMEMP